MAAPTERRVALVIGNSEYRNQSLVLPNPKNDADDVTAALRELEFEVIHIRDADKSNFDRALAQFARIATDANTALFYYAGHALQHQGRNYLMPIDAELEDELSIRFQMEAIDDVRAALDRSNGVKILILDACRNNPIVDQLRRKNSVEARTLARSLDSTRGLARFDKTQGMVVSYATAADQVAMDGSGRNSPYTAALLKRLREPGLEIEMMFRRIAADVSAQTNGRQRPETYVSLLSEYYLNQADRVAWERIKDSTDPAIFRNFISRFPASSRAADAQYRLQVVEQQLISDQRAIRERAERELALAVAQQRAQQLALAERERLERERNERERTQRERADRERIERERAERLALERRAQDERQQLSALQSGVEEERRRQSAVQPAPPPAAKPAASPDVPPQPYPGVSQGSDSCPKDQERLAKLRANPEAQELARFERELTCARLRPQIARLRESIGAAPSDPGASTPTVERSRTATGEGGVSMPGISAVRPLTLPPEQQCKVDAEKLAKLRETQVRSEILRFERELGCEKLRPQVVRLRESVAE